MRKCFWLILTGYILAEYSTMTWAKNSGHPEVMSLRGDWVSAGGGLLKDANNPWFLKNTESVNYCIAIDEENFGRPLEEVNLFITKAISYWQKEFAGASKTKGDFGITKQHFIFRPCPENLDELDNIDIAFQFGKLGKNQRSFLKDPRQYVAITIRTGYDHINLRGKGFIYVSPEKGPDRMSGDNVSPNPWSFGQEGGALFMVIIHELGHVFGIPHVQSGFVEIFDQGMPALMAEDFAETIVDKDYKGWWDSLAFIPKFFSFAINGCYTWEAFTGYNAPASQQLIFFDAPINTVALKFSFSQNETDFHPYCPVVQTIFVLASPDGKFQGPYTPIGKIVFDLPQTNTDIIEDGEKRHFETTIVISIRRSEPKQDVLHEENNSRTIYGPEITKYHLPGYYVSLNTGIKRPVFGHFEPNKATLDVVLDDGVSYVNFVGNLYQ